MTTTWFGGGGDDEDENEQKGGTPAGEYEHPKDLEVPGDQPLDDSKQ